MRAKVNSIQIVPGGYFGSTIVRQDQDLGCPRDLKSGNRKKHSITVLNFSIITNSLWELWTEFWAHAENLEKKIWARMNLVFWYVVRNEHSYQHPSSDAACRKSELPATSQSLWSKTLTRTPYLGEIQWFGISWAAVPWRPGNVWFRSGMVLSCSINYQKFGEFMFDEIITKKLVFTSNFSSV